MTEEERKEINPDLCAEGLRYILQNYRFDFAETAVLVGAITLLHNKSDMYPYQASNDLWKKRIIS